MPQRSLQDHLGLADNKIFTNTPLLFYLNLTLTTVDTPHPLQMSYYLNIPFTFIKHHPPIVCFLQAMALSPLKSLCRSWPMLEVSARIARKTKKKSCARRSGYVGLLILLDHNGGRNYRNLKKSSVFILLSACRLCMFFVSPKYYFVVDITL